VFLDVLDSLFSRLKWFQHFYTISHLTNPFGHTSSHSESKSGEIRSNPENEHPTFPAFDPVLKWDLTQERQPALPALD
jgi:hypothetical protein